MTYITGYPILPAVGRNSVRLDGRIWVLMKPLSEQSFWQEIEVRHHDAQFFDKYDAIHDAFERERFEAEAVKSGETISPLMEGAL